MKKICSLFDNIFNQISNFRFFEWGVIKICLIVLGILVGTYFYKFFLENIKIVWTIFLIFFAFSIYFVFVKKYSNNKNSIERK